MVDPLLIDASLFWRKFKIMKPNKLPQFRKTAPSFTIALQRPDD